MSTENTNTDVTETEISLDDFAAELFGGSEDKPSGDAKPEDNQEEDVEDGAPDETDTHSADDGATDDEDDLSEENPDETDEDDDDPKANQPKKANRFQERINEVTAARRAAERENEELKAELARLKQKPEENPPEPKPQGGNKTDTSAVQGPKPTDLNEDGTEKYPMGEFDPQFLRDTVQHMLTEQQTAQQAEAARLEQQRQASIQQAQLQESWNEKLEVARERYPDFQDKGEQMLSVFEGIDANYGEYLTTTLMEMDAGPDVFYYLANNVEEAKEIVNAGPRKATMALARLEAQLVGTPVNKATKPKVTKTSAPPPRLKGSAVSKGSVPLDTDDLAAFSKELFKR